MLSEGLEYSPISCFINPNTTAILMTTSWPIIINIDSLHHVYILLQHKGTDEYLTTKKYQFERL